MDFSESELCWKHLGWWKNTSQQHIEQRESSLDIFLLKCYRLSVCFLILVCASGSLCILLQWLFRCCDMICECLSCRQSSALQYCGDSWYLICMRKPEHQLSLSCYPAVLNPIALSVTYWNEWQYAAHSQAALSVHFKWRFSLAAQPFKDLSKIWFSLAFSFFHIVNLNYFCAPEIKQLFTKLTLCLTFWHFNN